MPIIRQIPPDHIQYHYGDYIAADPEWEAEFTKWVFKFLPKNSNLKIKKIWQREDQLGFKIDLIYNSLEIPLTFHCQETEPFKVKKSFFIGIISLPIPITKFDEVWYIFIQKALWDVDSGYRVVKNGQLMKDDSNPLIKLLENLASKDVSLVSFNNWAIKDSVVYTTNRRPYGFANELRLDLVAQNRYYKNINGTMQYEQYCSVTLNLLEKKKGQKKKIDFGWFTSSFNGLLKLFMKTYNGLISNLESLTKI